MWFLYQNHMWIDLIILVENFRLTEFALGGSCCWWQNILFGSGESMENIGQGSGRLFHVTWIDLLSQDRVDYWKVKDNYKLQ
jgi:hypothetical protein